MHYEGVGSVLLPSTKGPGSDGKWRAGAIWRKAPAIVSTLVVSFPTIQMHLSQGDKRTNANADPVGGSQRR
jgi:hypothetical protein